MTPRAVTVKGTKDETRPHLPPKHVIAYSMRMCIIRYRYNGYNDESAETLSTLVRVASFASAIGTSDALIGTLRDLMRCSWSILLVQ